MPRKTSRTIKRTKSKSKSKNDSPIQVVKTIKKGNAEGLIFEAKVGRKKVRSALLVLPMGRKKVIKTFYADAKKAKPELFDKAIENLLDQLTKLSKLKKRNSL